MKVSKIIVDGTEKEILLGINEDEIEINEEPLEKTIDLKEIIKEVNEQD